MSITVKLPVGHRVLMTATPKSKTTPAVSRASGNGALVEHDHGGGRWWLHASKADGDTAFTVSGTPSGPVTITLSAGATPAGVTGTAEGITLGEPEPV